MLQRFIRDNKDADVAQLALQRNRYPMLSDSDFRFCLQQIDGRQRTKDKLPLFATIEGWLYPPRLNLEQCSSERTARFKAELLKQLFSLSASGLSTMLIDATGGYGVDTFFMSAVAGETHYFEQNADLAAIAEHNFALAGKNIVCHAEPFELSNSKTLELLSTFNSQLSTLLYIDPARRDSHGGKVFRLEDCTPDVTQIVHSMRQNCPDVRVLLKLSPMLDFHQAIAQLGGCWDVYVVSVAGEVKELLLLSGGTNTVHAVSLDDAGEHIFTFTPDEESQAQVQYVSQPQPLLFQRSDLCSFSAAVYLYEPNVALLKAGAFRLLSSRYGLIKAAANTHLYLADNSQVFQQIPLRGRSWQVLGVYTRVKDVQRALARANIIVRNYVLSADALRKQLRLKDGGDDYIIGCRIGDKPLLLHCRRIQ